MPVPRESERIPTEVTRLLIAWRDGNGQAPGELFTILYRELRALAHAQLRRRRGQESLATTGLVHEAYLKLAIQSRLDLRDRGHFLALAARAMRQVVVDHARRRAAGKRGGGAIVDLLDENKAAADIPSADILALDEALARLEGLDPRLSRIVDMRLDYGVAAFLPKPFRLNVLSTMVRTLLVEP